MGNRLWTAGVAVLSLIVGAIILGGSPAQAVTEETIWGSSFPAAQDPDRGSVTVGLQFRTSVSGSVTAVRFYKYSGNTGTHVGRLYKGTTQVASVTFTGETASGWQRANLATPVSLTAGTTYTVAYSTTKGRYGVKQNYPWPKVSGNLTGIKGVYTYGSGAPTQVYMNEAYYVDPVFVAADVPPSTTTAPPTTTTAASTPVTTTDPTTPVSTTPVTTTTTPPSGSKPGPTNTGVPAGTLLTPYTGPHDITVPNTVIDSKDVTGALNITVPGVVIRNSKVHDDPGATAGINVHDGGSATITDTEIYNFQVGIVYGDWSGTRLNMHDMTFDNIKMSSNATLQDSWVHNPRPTSDAHWDGIQVQDGVTNTVIRHNVIDAGGADTNSALFLCPDLGPSTNGPLTVDGNWLNGGNYTVYILDGNNGQYFIKNISVTNNRFGRTFQYGPSDVNVPISQSGNVWDDTGELLVL